jgi:hypothetical protein
MYPRPVREGDEQAMAIGRAIDGALAEVGHQARMGRRPSVSAAVALAASRLDGEVEAAGVDLSDVERAKVLRQIESVVQAFRRSELFGLERPRTRVILIGGTVGVYAQPDYWDGRRRFFEMKSYPAIPPPPDVALQLRLFQLAFPQFDGVLVCLNRHTLPVETTHMVVPPPTAEETEMALRLALSVARERGAPKVLEYVEGPFVPYPLPSGGDRETGPPVVADVAGPPPPPRAGVREGPG